MNKKVVQSLLAVCCLALISHTALAVEPIWYDAARQAIAIEPSAITSPFVGIEFDFNADHTWAGVVNRNGSTGSLGQTTNPGLFTRTITSYPSGGYSVATAYGWGARLGSLAPVLNYESLVTTLVYGTPAVDKLFYFTPEWNVAEGKTTLYVRPAGALPGTDRPVQWSDLDNVYFRVGNTWIDVANWKKFTDVYPVEPPALSAAIVINPDTLNLKSKGKWITVYITPPQGYAANDIDVASVGIAVQTSQATGSMTGNKMTYAAGPSEIIVDNSGTELMVKFDRSTVSGLLAPGEADLMVSGRFTDGRKFEGVDAIRVN